MKKVKLNYQCILIIVFIFISSNSFSQKSSGGFPISYFRSYKTDIAPIQLPYFNNTMEAARADSIRKLFCNDCKNGSYGRGTGVSIDIKSQGQMEILEDGSKLWRLNIASTAAFALQFYFDKFKLPDGASLFFYNSDKTMKLGAFTSYNNPKDSMQKIQLATECIQGSNIYIEYHEPVTVQFSGQIHILNIIHIFKDIFNKYGPFSGNGSGPCNKNVICPEGLGWEKEIRSVVIILAYDENTQLTGWCTGSLINNTDQDGRPLFLTANHCINNTTGVANNMYSFASWVFLFNHQTSVCNSDGSEVSSYTGQSVSGAIFLASDANKSPTSDYVLLQLNTSKETLASYGACYAGWTLNTPQPPFTGIHHPHGDVKKISIENDNIYSTDYASTANNPNGTHWQVPDWDIGTTEGGSSGSPLFDLNHRIIGQLHGGGSDCNGLVDNSRSDWYGKLTTSWLQGGFKYWLDPYSTGATSLDTYCSVSTGSNPGEGTSSCPGCFTCTTKLSRDQFLINGHHTGVEEVCMSNPIKLTPSRHPLYDSQCGLNTWFPIISSTETGWCDAIKSKNPAYCNFIDYTLGTRCECTFWKLFISVIECDYNLSLIGQEYAYWANLKYNDVKGNIRQTLNLLDYLPPGLTLQPNKYYKLKLAGDYGGWDEGTRYFHTYSDNIDLNGYNLNKNINGKTIVLSNSTVNQNITIVASNSINLQANTSIKAGWYKIDPTQSCFQFQSMRLSSHRSVESGNQIVKSIKESIITDSQNQSFSIFPNPNNGKFRVSLVDSEKSLSKVSVYSPIGNLIYQSETISEYSDIDISACSKGIYYVKIVSGSEIVLKKIVNL